MQRDEHRRTRDRKVARCPGDLRDTERRLVELLLPPAQCRPARVVGASAGPEAVDAPSPD